ncbi:S26 family signal peptidase [Laspinema palackyanum]|uniref:S26 family signal peptidase n=1 Tax=Laspinema palackyanum TaxID=3231601 RepID=UPI00345C927F|nr:S26 family signal peptidase [Laspinema sp. D2c]
MGVHFIASIAVILANLFQQKIKNPDRVWQELLTKNYRKNKKQLKTYISGTAIDLYALNWADKSEDSVNLESIDAEQPINLASQKTILEIYQESNHRLLILGEPDSGKTTELLKLAVTLGETAQRDPSQPVPVIFEFSRWQGEPILDWMVAEIVSEYNISAKLCRGWLVSNRIIPLLDGLDKLGEKAKDAIDAIDDLQDHPTLQQPGLVICCRVKDYENLKDENNFLIRFSQIEQAVKLCELSDYQIQHYLNQNHVEHLWNDLQSHPGFMKLARRPMLLTLMPMTYPQGLPDNQPESDEDFQSQLFDDFLARTLYPPTGTPQPLAEYEPEKAKYYLAWLAANMERNEIDPEEFVVEKLQPTWLEKRKSLKQYQLIVNGIFSLALVLVMAPFQGLILSFLLGLIIFTLYQKESIVLTENFDWSWKNLKKALFILGKLWFKNSFNISLVISTIAVIFILLQTMIKTNSHPAIVITASVVFIPIVVPIVALFLVLLVMLVFAVYGGLVGGLVKQLRTELKSKNYPNQGTWQTGKNSLVIFLSTSFLYFMFITSVLVIIKDPINVYNILGGSVLAACFADLIYGGGYAFIQHFGLRYVLYQQGKIPKDYVNFLNKAADCNILKQFGGRYRFYGQSLRKHLAASISLNVEPLSPRKTTNSIAFQLNRAKLPLALIAFLFLMGSVVQFTNDSIQAMSPIFQSNDLALHDTIWYPKLRNPERYQVISFSTEGLKTNFPSDFTSRRIVALPGETLEIGQGKIIINGNLLIDERIKISSNFSQPSITLASNEYYVIADNSNYRHPETYGTVVPLENIRSQMVLRIYPFNRVGLIR